VAASDHGPALARIRAERVAPSDAVRAISEFLDEIERCQHGRFTALIKDGRVVRVIVEHHYLRSRPP
jgi:hypothetical protein